MNACDSSPVRAGQVSIRSAGACSASTRGSLRDAVLEDRLHALRSGLAAVAGAVGVLTEHRSEVSESQRDRLESMLTAEVTRLQRLVAAPEAFAADSVAEELDLDEVIGNVVLARTVVGQRVHWQPSGHTVVARRDELVEVLTILLVNAYRHADGSPARVEVTSSDGMVRVSVTDDGPGIPDYLRDVIFERGARRTESPGQGLGLSIARELVSDLGGTLALERDCGRGARFDVQLRATELDGAA
jgi:K+-sensing histidine kinase KdpD